MERLFVVITVDDPPEKPPEKLEKELLSQYFKKHGELPPLNRQG